MGLCLNLHIFIYTPPTFFFSSKLSPPRILVFLLRSLGPHKGPARGRWRHIISLARRLLGAGLMDSGPSARTGSVGYSLPPWSPRSSSSAWSLRERWKPLLLLAPFVSLSGSVSGTQTAPVSVLRLSFVWRCPRSC